MNEQEDILKKVIRFGCILQDSQGNSAYETGVTTKQDCQRFPPAQADFGHQDFVGKRCLRDVRLDGTLLLFGNPKLREANCDGTIHGGDFPLTPCLSNGFPALSSARRIGPP